MALTYITEQMGGEEKWQMDLFGISQVHTEALPGREPCRRCHCQAAKVDYLAPLHRHQHAMCAGYIFTVSNPGTLVVIGRKEQQCLWHEVTGTA